ncbi:hypothetical protein HYH03_015731 [Edaphochlamys debaryana]|uniref:Uncharacterized protein n=1 Tax=Edaphochlamys debaryana TaxID=47281 RepID=A0A835XIY1_9CHLO|nr:hypothetical protein HYH03_015731 [Edaphochlamys debaryana]|eukprot:KAG2485567.1 hypothetical protein HYH03_015731 [Edaphochlamys debaryana]
MVPDVADENAGTSGKAHHHSRHFWEDDVARFLHPEVPRECRHAAFHSGLPVGKTGHRPLLLATVKGKDDDGRPFHWVARRARKRVHQPHECAKPAPPMVWLAALRPDLHWRKPGWWVGFLFAFGSVVWLFTGIARLFKSIALPDPKPPGLASLAAGMAGWPQMVALYLMFWPACIIQVYEATNMDLPARLRAWKAATAPGPDAADQAESGDHLQAKAAAAAKADSAVPKAASAGTEAHDVPSRPRPRLLPSRAALGTVSWWLAMIQLVGIMLFLAAATPDMVENGKLLSGSVNRWVEAFLSFIGGACFTFSSWVATLELTGSHWRGLVPNSWSNLRSISWISVFFAFQGSLGFMTWGLVLFAYTDIGWHSFQALLSYGQIFAPICFVVANVAGLLEQANPGHR